MLTAAEPTPEQRHGEDERRRNHGRMKMSSRRPRSEGHRYRLGRTEPHSVKQQLIPVILTCSECLFIILTDFQKDEDVKQKNLHLLRKSKFNVLMFELFVTWDKITKLTREEKNLYLLNNKPNMFVVEFQQNMKLCCWNNKVVNSDVNRWCVQVLRLGAVNR